MLSRIFANNRQKVTGAWEKVQNEELPNLYASFGLLNQGL
jgi:hypothetical protein